METCGRAGRKRVELSTDQPPRRAGGPKTVSKRKSQRLEKQGRFFNAWGCFADSRPQQRGGSEDPPLSQEPGCGSGSKPGGGPLVGWSRTGLPLVGTEERLRGGEALSSGRRTGSPRR